MGEFEQELEQRTLQAWLALAEGMVQVMQGLEPEEFFYIEVDVAREEDEVLDGAVPYVQVMRYEGGVHVEVSSNRHLATRFRLDKATRRTMRSLGLTKPSAKRGLENYWAQFGLDHLEDAAYVMMRALREGFHVLHPVFLDAQHPDIVALLRPNAEAMASAERRRAGEETPNLLFPVEGEEVATYIEDLDHLRSLVIQALTPSLGITPEPDEDGDIGVVAGSSLIFVRVSPEAPMVFLQAQVVVDVEDEAAALLETAELNREHPGVQFTVFPGQISAGMVLPAAPFVPTLLRLFLNRLTDVVGSVDEDLARKVGGHTCLAGLEG